MIGSFSRKGTAERLTNATVRSWFFFRFFFVLCPPTPYVFAQALEKFNIEKDIAAYIKKEFDKKYNPTWHCIVGRNFGELTQIDCAAGQQTD